MNAVSKIEAATGLALLRAPFPPNQISKLPKESRKQIDERKSRAPGCMVWNCPECGNMHHKDAVHLDYVGHAAATDRLLDADPRWTWEPVPDPASMGFPMVPGGMWIKLTVDGVSRYGFGCADGKSGGDAIKEVIGDAIRNAGMRFGMALDLWHKGDLHVDADEAEEPKREVAAGISAAQCAELRKLLKEADSSEEAFVEWLRCGTLPELPSDQFQRARNALTKRIKQMEQDKKKSPQSSELLADDSIPY